MPVGEVVPDQVPDQVLRPVTETDINTPRTELPGVGDRKLADNGTEEKALDTHYYYG
jgi:hypothetical protein